MHAEAHNQQSDWRISAPLIRVEASARLERPFGPATAALAGLQCKANFERYLIVINNSVLDVASCLYDFEPSHIPDSCFGPRDGILNCVFDTLIRRSHQFQNLVNMIFH
jgi:hypothetical protein